MIDSAKGLLKLLGLVGLSASIAPPTISLDEIDYALLRHIASPESGGFYSNSYTIKVTPDGRIHALETFGEKKPPLTHLDFSKLLNIFLKQSFHEVPGDLTLQSDHCKTIELHGSLYIVELKTHVLTHRVELDTGCKDFEQEDNLTNLIEHLEQRLGIGDLTRY